MSVITHNKVLIKQDGLDPSKVQPSNWNDDHYINLPALVALFQPITPVLSGPHTAAANPGLNIFTIYNSGSSAFTFNLPATPALNQIVQVIDAGLTAGTHQINVAGNGNTICAYGATGSSAGINSNGGSISLAWDGIQWTQNA